MPLKIYLKPDETVLIAGAFVRNGGKLTALVIENRVPILRFKDIMREENATTPAQLVYYTIQQMYIDPANMKKYAYDFNVVSEKITNSLPETKQYLCTISDCIELNDFYPALKVARDLVRFESEVLMNAIR